MTPCLINHKSPGHSDACIHHTETNTHTCMQSPSLFFWPFDQKKCRTENSEIWTSHVLTLSLFSFSPYQLLLVNLGSGIAQWLERWTCDWKVLGSNPCRSGGRIFFSRVNFLCSYFGIRSTAVARKRSRSFCQKCRWHVTAKHTYTLHMWLCMKWHVVWCTQNLRWWQQFHASTVSIPLRWIFKNAL